jgi:hypothetical protein
MYGNITINSFVKSIYTNKIERTEHFRISKAIVENKVTN